MLKDLILVGGGGHCKSVIDVAESAGYRIIGILDMPSEVGKSVLSYPIIGSDNDISNYARREGVYFAITVGQIKDSSARIRIYEKILAAGGKLPPIISSTAYVSKYAVIGDGTVVMHRAVINAGASVGRNCIINTFANIEHDVQIGSFCHISTGAMINGGCRLGDRVFIGSSASLTQMTVVANDVIVPIGAVVRYDILQAGIYR